MNDRLAAIVDELSTMASELRVSRMADVTHLEPYVDKLEKTGRKIHELAWHFPNNLKSTGTIQYGFKEYVGLLKSFEQALLTQEDPEKIAWMRKYEADYTEKKLAELRSQLRDDRELLLEHARRVRWIMGEVDNMVDHLEDLEAVAKDLLA